ncbi:hypothetical protein Tco_1484539 [Tanacetum coccineum]
MANTQTSFHSDKSSHITYIQHPQPNNNFVPQPSFNTNYLQHQMQNPEDISDLTTAFDMALELMSKAFQLNNTTTTNNNQRSSSNPCFSQIALKEEAGIQLTQEEFDFMADASAYEEIKRVNANCTLKDNLQQASTSSTQTDKAPVYDSDELAKLLEPIPESHQVPQNDSNVISEVPSMEQSGGTVEQRPATSKETRALYDSLYNNLATEVEKVNSVNRKLRETNADLTTELKVF